MSGDPRLHSRQWRTVRALVLARDRWTCQIQGEGCRVHANTVDHITARSDGGAFYDPANLRAACAHCNYSRQHPARLAGLARRYRRGRFVYQTTIPPLQTRL